MNEEQSTVSREARTDEPVTLELRCIGLPRAGRILLLGATRHRRKAGSSMSNTNRFPLSPRLMRISESTYVVSNDPFAAGGALIGTMLPILNVSNWTLTWLLDTGVRSAVTALKKGKPSLF